jgi:hypothetical protein
MIFSKSKYAMIDGGNNLYNRTNIHKFIRVLIRFILPVAASLYLIYVVCRIPSDTIEYWAASLDFSFRVVVMLALVIVLALLNWLFEAVKWRLLAGQLQAISIKEAFIGILYGVSLGMITPRRVGEVAGRAMVLKPEYRWKGMVINTAGSIAQLGVSLVFGLLSVAFVLFQGTTASSFPLGFPLGALAILLLLLVTAKPAISRLLTWPKLPGWARVIDVFSGLGLKEMTTLLVLSVFRYSIFLMQFYMLLVVFGVPLSMFYSMLLLSIVFLILAAIPVSALGEAGIRGSVVLLAYGFVFGSHHAFAPGVEPGLLAAILSLWLINLVLPASAGAVLALSGRISIKSSMSKSVPIP